MVSKPPGKRTAHSVRRNASVMKADDSPTAFLTGGGDMGAVMRSMDWSKTPVGQHDTWSESLRASLGIILNSSFPMFVWWGKSEMTNFYNDAYKEILGNKHPHALGKPAKEAWGEIWDSVGPLAEQVFTQGEPVFIKNLHLVINRSGYDEDTYFTFSYSPIRDKTGTIAGLFCAVTETTEEVLSQQLLRESEDRFRNLADTAPMYIAMADESGNAVYFNKPWLDFTGKKIEEMVGMGWLVTLHPEDKPRFERDFMDAFQKQITINNEYRFKRADGEYRWMLAVGAPRYTPDGHFNGYFGTYTDFHELKEAQLEIQSREERFRTLIEKSADAVQLVNEKGEILYTSESIRNVLGYSPKDLQNGGIMQYLHPEDTDYFFTRFNKLLKQPGKQITFQYRVKHKDGSWAWLETVGVNHLETENINALVGNFRNITKQKEAEELVRSSEIRFKALADNIPNLAWMARADGYIYWYNKQWYSYTGTKPEDMEGWGWQSVHDEKVLPKVLIEWKRAIESGQQFEMVFPLKAADKTSRPFLTRVVPLRDAEGNITQWVGTNTDISEQLKIKKTEARNEELEAITKQLALQRKELLALNQAKDEFISLASHQLRTPATAVKQYIGLLLEDFAGPISDSQRQYLQIAYTSNENELSLINDLLKTAQLESNRYSLTRKRHDLIQIISDCIEELRPTLKLRRQTMQFNRSVKTLSVSVDETELRLAFSNLLDNASKYSPLGSKISVAVKKNTKSVTISFIDAGVGVEPKNQQRIFDKFTRVNNELSDTVTGTGLGLYWVKKIVELHKGKIKLDSELGKGSVFTIRFPL